MGHSSLHLCMQPLLPTCRANPQSMVNRMARGEKDMLELCGDIGDEEERGRCWEVCAQEWF